MPDCPRNWMRFRVRTPPPLSPATTRRAPANVPQRMAHRNGMFAVSARRHSTAERLRRTAQPGTRTLVSTQPPPSLPRRGAHRRTGRNARAQRMECGDERSRVKRRYPFALQPREPDRAAGTATHWRPLDRRSACAKTLQAPAASKAARPGTPCGIEG